MQNKIYRVLQNDEVVAIFNRKDYANDFIDYQATISGYQMLPKYYMINGGNYL